MRVGVALAVAATALLTAAWQRPDTGSFGFTRPAAAVQQRVERRFLARPSADRIRDAHQVLTDQPHLAGSARDRALAEWTRVRFERSGLDEVAITTHDVLLPWPEEVSVEMTAPRPWRAAMREEPIAGDPHTRMEHADPGIPYHAYSKSGDITAPVVYAGYGQPEDYDWLTTRGIDVRGRIVLVRNSVPYSYRGFKALTAEQRGAAAVRAQEAEQHAGGPCETEEGE
jgi:N-acetylated-alpha-linked acidic dipeptidase